MHLVVERVSKTYRGNLEALRTFELNLWTPNGQRRFHRGSPFQYPAVPGKYKNYRPNGLETTSVIESISLAGNVG
jgi:hypothetical protein